MFWLIHLSFLFFVYFTYLLEKRKRQFSKKHEEKTSIFYLFRVRFFITWKYRCLQLFAASTFFLNQQFRLLFFQNNTRRYVFCVWLSADSTWSDYFIITFSWFSSLTFWFDIFQEPLDLCIYSILINYLAREKKTELKYSFIEYRYEILFFIRNLYKTSYVRSILYWFLRCTFPCRYIRFDRIYFIYSRKFVSFLLRAKTNKKNIYSKNCTITIMVYQMKFASFSLCLSFAFRAAFNIFVVVK